MVIKKYSSDIWKKRGFPDFHIFKRINAMSDDEHIHDFIEIVYMLGGDAKEIINGVEYELKAGDMLIMDYGCNHTVLAIDNLAYVNILIYPDIMEENRVFFQKSFSELTEQVVSDLPADLKHKKVSFTGISRRRIEQLLELLLQEQNSNEMLSEIMKESYMISLLVEIRRKQNEGHSQRFENFDEMLLFINNNLSEDFTMEDFAKKFFYNPSYFSRMFKEKTGQTFREYVYKKRMEKAAMLLAHTDISVNEIISLVGYESRSSFFRNFAKEYGMTPLEYRNVHKGEALDE